MKKFFTPQVRIAIVAILAIVVLFFGIQFLRGISLFSNDAHYKIKFNDITGLSTSTPVYARGFKVGIVRNIDYDYDKLGESITVDIDVEKTLRIPEGTTAEIVSDIMGNVKVVLQFGKSTKFLEPNGWIDGVINDGTLGDLKSMVPSIQKMLPKLDSILGSVNTLLADPALQSSVHNIDKITANLTTSTRLTAKLNSNEGTMGLMLNDASLYNNLNSTMRSADSLLTNLKAHPKRYVHFSLFGRKDK